MPAGPAPVAALLEPLLAELAGEGARAVSIAFEFARVLPAGAVVRLEADTERSTRTLAFLQGRILNGDGAPAASASAIFSRPPPNVRRMLKGCLRSGVWLRRRKARAIRRAA